MRRLSVNSRSQVKMFSFFISCLLLTATSIGVSTQTSPFSDVCLAPHNKDDNPITKPPALSITTTTTIPDTQQDCPPSHKSYLDPSSDSYKSSSALLHCLLVVMTISGVLAILSNTAVLYVTLRVQHNLFEPSILSLACVDLLYGLLCTPLVCLIYYHSECRQPANLS